MLAQRAFDLTVENAMKHPSRFIGPNVAGAVVQALESGILINQSIRFWSRASREHWLIKLMVLFVSLSAVVQTIVGVYNTWRVTVSGYGQWILVLDLAWYDRIQPGFTCTMAGPVQAFLIWRCWNAMGRRTVILTPLVVLLLGTIIVNVLITVQIFDFNWEIFILVSNRLPLQFVTAFILSSVLDIIITSLMLWFLIRAKSQVVSRRFGKIIGRLLIMLWEAAVPPCACSIAACILYVHWSLDNFWDVFCQCILGKLYVISLFVILNGRADLRALPAVLAPPTAGLSRYWVSAAEARLHLTTIVDQNDPSELDIDMTPRTANFDLDLENATSSAPEVRTWEDKALVRPASTALTRQRSHRCHCHHHDSPGGDDDSPRETYISLDRGTAF